MSQEEIEQKPLLKALEDSEDNPKQRVLPERIRVMLKAFGNTAGKTCKQCVHLIKHRQGTCWFKCNLTIQTGGMGTDWRSGWPACGKYEDKRLRKP